MRRGRTLVRTRAELSAGGSAEWTDAAVGLRARELDWQGACAEEHVRVQ